MNIAQRIKYYYESKDFRDNYAMYLLEDTHGVKDNIQHAWKHSFDLGKYYTGDWISSEKKDLTDQQLNEILEFLIDNIEDFTTEFYNGCVGDCSVDSIAYGEQEEQLDIYNHKTGKPYTLPYLRKVFEQEGFCISDNYAYYDLSFTGVHIDLSASKIPLLEKLFTEISNTP